MFDPHANLTEEQKKAKCPFTAMSKQVEARVYMQQLAKLNKILGESTSLDKMLRAVTYGMLLIKGLLLVAGASEDGNTVKVIGDLYGKLSTTRFVNHIIGAPAQLAAGVAAMKGPVGETSEDKQLRKLKVMQHLAMFFYFLFEHMIMLSRLVPNVLGTSDATWLRRTCTAWTVFNVSSALEAMVRGKTKTNDDKLRLSSFILDLILAVSWSRKKPFLGPVGIGAIGAYGGAVGFFLRWKSEP